MEIKRLNASQFLLPDEKVELKVERKAGSRSFIQTLTCYIFFLLSITGDCFFIGLITTLKEILKDKGVNNFLLPLSIITTALHIVPFIFWLVFILQNKAKEENKWYVLTNKRLCIVGDSKTFNVVSVWYDKITAMKVVKKAVHINVGEERIVLDNLDSASSFGAKLESILNDDVDNENQPFAPEIHTVALEEKAEEEIKANPSESEEKVEDEKKVENQEVKDENITEKLDQILQDYADDVLKEKENKGENNGN